MLRKLKPGEGSAGLLWTGTADYTNSFGETLSINEYFVANPQMMLGEMRLTGRMYRRNEPTLENDGRNLAGSLAEAIGLIAQGHFSVPEAYH